MPITHFSHLGEWAALETANSHMQGYLSFPFIA